MPLIKSKSKKAFEKNVETEMKANPDPKDRAKNLAIAYSIKRKAAKKMAEGSKADGKKDKEAAPLADKIEEQVEALAKPRYAKGGRIPVDGPKMVESSIIKPHRYADGGAVKNPSGMSMDNLTSGIKEMFGGKSKKTDEPIHDPGPIHPKYAGGGTISYTNKPDKGYGAIIFKAEGGEVEDEHHDSIASAIMARKARMENGRYEHPEDAMLKEGEVDLDDNGREMPNAYYHQNEEEALEENLDHDIMDKDQPKYSNEHGDSIDSDDRDMISQIRAKIHAKRMFR